MGGGSVLELGVYPIQFCQFIFQQEPKSIKAIGTLNSDGIDLEMKAELNYGGNKVGKISSSGLVSPDPTAKIVGTKGTMMVNAYSKVNNFFYFMKVCLFLKVPSFWCPTSVIDVDGTEKHWPLPNAKFEFNFNNSAGLRYEADEVRKCVRAGKKESDKLSQNESIMIARIEDEIRRQIGVQYPQDD